MYRFKTWYASTKMLGAIGTLGSNIYEREILRVLLIRYSSIYSKDIYHHKVNVHLKPSDFSSVMGRKKYFDSLKNLKTNEVIEYSSVKGRKGYQIVSLITSKTIGQIKAKRFSVAELLAENEVYF